MNNETFVYMGGDMVVPQNIVRVRVHPSVTVIPEKAFHERNRLEEVELSEGLLEIGEWAFSCWSGLLKEIKIPSSVQSIGSNAFEHCHKLEKVTLCEGLLEIGSNAFYHCYSLKRISIPSTVTNIHDWAFADCDGMEDVKLCNGLLEIGEFAFVSCSLLKQINIPSTVNVIGKGAFKDCRKLAEVYLPEGLVEIGEMAFYYCDLYSINIPSTVKRICCWSFANNLIQHLSLPESIESIGGYAFCDGNYYTVRIPPLITTLTESMCRSLGMFSIDLPESIERVNERAFDSNRMLRNLALPSHCEIGVDVFKDCIDLKQLGTERNIINALQHRFDNLPIHKMLYYQSYRRQNMARNKFDDPSIKQQDTLGMTPLHILACSTTQTVEMYRILINKHPESLITKDRWGAIPLLYAIWSKASSDIVQLLVQSYKLFFPNYKFNWTSMMETLATFSATGTETRFLHNIQKESFPNQSIDLDALVEKAITNSNSDHPNYISRRTLQVLTDRIISTRALAIRSKALRRQVMKTIRTKITTDTIQGRRDYVNIVHRKLEACEDKDNRRMEAFTSIELVLWKMKMDDCCCGHQKKTRQTKILRIDDLAMRKQCRIRCGAETNIVIEHVLPYLDYFST